ncbi:GAF domain-containing protein [Paenibacillus pinistramenti]|uniref:GAF domain-containing protein n=1 Tax=Paenibacillus pinistramenti TaxID=1768003 RepID=UPI001109B810|nr:GAF domain-containing protein [Paenibacillus pinistramenti]
MNNTQYQAILDEMRSQFDYDFMSLALVEPAEFNYVIKWKFASGNLNDGYKRILLKSGRGVPGIVFKTGKPLLIPYVPDFVGPENIFQYPIIKLEDLISLVAVPVWHDGRVAGILLGGYRDDRRVTVQSMQDLQKLVSGGLHDLNGKEMMPS